METGMGPRFGRRGGLQNEYNGVVFICMEGGFTAAAAREIVGISQRRLDYWDEEEIVQPSVKVAKGKGTERRYSFNDLLRLSFVKRLRDGGLSMQRIRKGLERLRQRWPKKDPLLDEHLVTDGVSFYRVNGPNLEDILGDGQLVFGVIGIGKMRQELQEKASKLEATGIPARGKRVG